MTRYPPLGEHSNCTCGVAGPASTVMIAEPLRVTVAKAAAIDDESTWRLRVAYGGLDVSWAPMKKIPGGSSAR